MKGLDEKHRERFAECRLALAQMRRVMELRHQAELVGLEGRLKTCACGAPFVKIHKMEFCTQECAQRFRNNRREQRNVDKVNA